MIPVICASCGADNDAGRKFCLECGTPLAAACPACGSPNPPAARFCGECGARLAGTAATALPATAPARPGASPAPAVAERRVVSVLFADLVGFTTIAETRDAEEVRDLLSRYFDLARGIVERHGGTIEKFIGDAVMAVWGAPTSHEDDAERAVRAALEVVSGVRGLGPMVHARVGVVTGEAAVTIGAVGEGMVAGDMVNTASRLQGAAPPDVVLVGEATMHAASRATSSSRARPRRSRPGAPFAWWPSAAAGGGPKRSRRPSWGEMTSCGFSRTSTTRPPGTGAYGSSP
jgi:class 3 adenylate cyclase